MEPMTSVIGGVSIGGRGSKPRSAVWFLAAYLAAAHVVADRGGCSFGAVGRDLGS